jgi:hypothetical protein
MVYLTKSIRQAAGVDERATDAQRDHVHRLHAELQITPCSPRCAVWLLYGIQPKGARHSMTPGTARAKPTSPNTLASPDAASWSPESGRTRPSTYRYVGHPPEQPSGRYPQVSRRAAVQAAPMAGLAASSGGQVLGKLLGSGP